MIARAFCAAVCAMTLAATAAVTMALGHPQGRRSQAADTFAAYLPPGEGKALVAKGCVGCHDLGGTVRLRAAAPKWEALVLDMGARGAPIELDDVDPIVRYLSTVFGPNAPPFIDANAASKVELIKLPGVSPEAADRLIAARSAGPLSSADQVRTALGLDTPAFEKIKYYVYVKSAPPDRNR
jgi:mono/diheme cytochrome c family protein